MRSGKSSVFKIYSQIFAKVFEASDRTHSINGVFCLTEHDGFDLFDRFVSFCNDIVFPECLETINSVKKTFDILLFDILSSKDDILRNEWDLIDRIRV
jgi:hypothetical protein